LLDVVLGQVLLDKALEVQADWDQLLVEDLVF